MAYMTFTAGSVLTAAQMMTYLMNQVIIKCTSGTRPSGPDEGMTIYETDTDKILTYDGSGWIEAGKYGAWATYTHGWNGTIGNGTVNAVWQRLFGRTIAFNILVTWGSTTSAPGGTWTVNLPTAPARIGVASAIVTDSSAGFWWQGNAYLVATASAGVDHVILDSVDTSTIARSVSLSGGTTPFTWATGDKLAISGVYESAA